MLFFKGELLTYSAFADFAPTPAHANFSQTISDRLLLEGTSCKLAPARGLKDTSYKLAPAWGLLLEGTSYKLAPAWATFLSIKSKNMKAPRG